MRGKCLALRSAGCVLALILVISCGGAGATPAPTPPSALEILTAACETFQKVTTAHFEMTLDEKIQAQGQTADISISFLGDLVSPDRLKGTVEMGVLGRNVKVETIVIGDTTYTKDSTTGQWQTTTQASTGLTPQEFMRCTPEQFRDPKLVGQENLGGTPVYHVSGNADLDLSLMQGLDVNAGSMSVDYWIDQETSHVLKAAVTGQMVASVEGVDATVDVDITLLLSDYGKAVTIEPPQ